MKTTVILMITSLMLLFSCTRTEEFFEDFDKYNDRIWITRDFWSIPLEDWKISNGRVESSGDHPKRKLNLLTRTLEGEGSFHARMRLGSLAKAGPIGYAGFAFGLKDETDNDPRSVCYFGKGTIAGIQAEGKIFIGEKSVPLPEPFEFTDLTLDLTVYRYEGSSKVLLECIDIQGSKASVEVDGLSATEGMIALECAGDYWFDDFRLKGSMVKPGSAFGPILFTMYTLSRGSMKLTAQMPPLGEDDNQEVELQLLKGRTYHYADKATIMPDARIASFRMDDWDASEDVFFRVVYKETYREGSPEEYVYEGLIRKEPEKEELVMGGLTCQYHYGFPYKPLTESLLEMDPDILYFSGDQIYEGNGGYGIIRYPADRAILNYLGKWYMFGWAFAKLMDDRPTICTPDDHDVFQGNLWGEGGKLLTEEQWNAERDCIAGFVEPVEMVNVVMKTNCSHLPDPVDPRPMKNDIQVYYTDLVYGGVSFAIVGDRVFKSGPERVANWEGRLDHLKKPLKDPSILDKPGLTLLGDRQMEFLDQWVRDWKGTSMKVLLSQTIFTYASTHSGNDSSYLEGDLDSGGWPKRGRDEAIGLIRKAFAFHICGDQHLPYLIQYGIEDCRDAGWVFCTPAIAVGYQRYFHPDKLGWPVVDRPAHGNPNTGCYKDGFGNLNYIYAVGNPDEINRHENRYTQADLRSSGFGIIRFNLGTRDITAEAYRFLSKSADGGHTQFSGWPHTINQLDNYGREPVAYLPPLDIQGMEDPVVEVTNEVTGDLAYILRIKGNRFKPMVFSTDPHTVRVGDPEKDQWKTIQDVKPILMDGYTEESKIKVEF
jgi:alkaline phosphatase D